MHGMSLPFQTAFVVNGLTVALIVLVPLGFLAYFTVRVIRTRRATRE